MNENKPANPWAKSLMIWMAVLFGLVMLSQMFGGERAAPAGSIPYSQFVSDVNEGNVQSVDDRALAGRQHGDLGQAAGRQGVHHHRAGRRQRLRPPGRQGRRGPGQGRGAVELLDDHAGQLAAVHHHPRHQLLRHAPDAEECRRRGDGLRQVARQDADPEGRPRDLRRRRRASTKRARSSRKSSNI